MSENQELKNINITDVLSQTKKRADAACAAMSKITKVETPEEDAAAEALLVRVRATYEQIQSERMPYTKHLDNAKELLMQAEKRVSNKTEHKDSDYHRIKRLRDEYHQKLADKAEEEKKEAQKDQRRREELLRMKQFFETTFFNNIVQTVYKLDESLNSIINNLTLENYEEISKRLNVKPNLKKEIFESWFAIEYDKEAVSEEQFNDFMSQVKGIYTYDFINDKYLLQAEPILKAAIEKLPSIKQKLEDIAKSSETEAEELRKKMEEENNEALRKREETRQAEAAENAAEAEAKASEEKLNIAFDATVALSQVHQPSGARKNNIAIIDCEDAKIVETLARVMFACFMHPKFIGYVKREKNGTIKMEDGIPVYQPWVKTLLDFYAANVDMPIDGITLKQKISTVQRSNSK